MNSYIIPGVTTTNTGGGVIFMSNQGNMVGGMASEMGNEKTPSIAERMRRLIPKRKYCEKCRNTLVMNDPKEHDKFCSNCGGELDEYVGEIYITINTQYQSPAHYENKEKNNNSTENTKPSQYQPPDEYDTRTQISIRELYVLLKEYEKEMVVEGL